MVCRGLFVLAFLVLSTSANQDAATAVCDSVSCDQGESCNPTNGECIQDAPPTAKLHVWLGDGPDNCVRQPSDCSRFMMDYDVSHPHGGTGDWCSSGQKIRCVVIDAPPLDPPTPDNELRVIAYNVFERGFYVSLDAQSERTCRIPHVLAADHPDVDVITFQECFMGGCFPRDGVSIRDLLAHVGFPYFTETLRSPEFFQVENGGIFVASRWPILEEDQLIFKSYDNPSWDMFSAKGVSYAKILKGERVYHVMSTHFQAGSHEAKVNQSLEWAQFVQGKNLPADEPVIFSGDLNADYFGAPGSTFWQVMDNLQTEVPQLVGPYNATANPVINDLLKLKGRTDWGSWIDHAVYSKVHLKPIRSTNTILRPIDAAFPVCWCEECINPLRWSHIYPEDESCPGTTEHLQDLSDHQPVLGEFIFN